MRGSRFVAVACRARDEAEVRALLESERARHPDATHHCWAARLGAAGSGEAGERSHDAGEPPGTAGVPILQAIRSAGLVEVAVVVTRWFGGTKLGKGGLARAYRDAARAALQAAPIVAATPMTARTLRVPVELDGAARHVVARHGARVVAVAYEGDAVALDVDVPQGAEAALFEALGTLTRGRAILGPRPAGAPRSG